MNLTTTVTPDLANGVVLLTIRGDLTLESIPTARAVLLKCLAQCPDAVLVNVAEMHADTRSLLTVFPAAVRTNGTPATALVLYGASAELAALMEGRVLGEVCVYDTFERAMAAATGGRVMTARKAHLHLAPTPAAAAMARSMIREACSSWQIDHLTWPATLVISELVSNAVQHARTDLYISAVYRGNYLHLSVRDGTQRQPVPVNLDPYGDVPLAELPEHGRGLQLVDVCTTAWGCHPTGNGKTVWATIRATPISGTTG